MWSLKVVNVSGSCMVIWFDMHVANDVVSGTRIIGNIGVLGYTGKTENEHDSGNLV